MIGFVVFNALCVRGLEFGVWSLETVESLEFRVGDVVWCRVMEEGGAQNSKKEASGARAAGFLSNQCEKERIICLGWGRPEVYPSLLSTCRCSQLQVRGC